MCECTSVMELRCCLLQAGTYIRYLLGCSDVYALCLPVCPKQNWSLVQKQATAVLFVYWRYECCMLGVVARPQTFVDKMN